MKRAWSDHARTVETTSTLEALLATGQFARVDLLRIGCPFGSGGTTWLTYTSADVSITWDGVVYSALTSPMKRTQVRTIIGVEVDTMDVELLPYVPKVNPSVGAAVQTLDTIPGSTVTLTQAAQQGLLDGAAVELRLLFLPSPPQWQVAPDLSAGTVLQFVGLVGEATVTRSKLTLKCRSKLDELKMQLPRNKWQAGCLNALYDATCAVSKTATVNGQALQQAVTVDAGSSTTLSLALTSAITQPDGFFDLGWIEMASGAFQGLRRSVKHQAPQSVTLSQPFPQNVLPDVGTVAMVLHAGCDKSLKTCIEKFNNRTNFRGAVYIPNPESAF